MAGLYSEGDGKRKRWAIRFEFDGKRRNIRLTADAGHELAHELKAVVERLVVRRTLNQEPDERSARWLAEQDEKGRGWVYDKLAAKGLLQPREKAVTTTLGGWCDKYLEARRYDARPKTLEAIAGTLDKLRQHFGDDTPLESLTPNEAKDFELELIRQGLSDASVRHHGRNLKRCFNDAAERELIARNPFKKFKSAARSADDAYVDIADVEKVMGAIDDPQVRLVLGLARFAGLRIPSEIWGAEPLPGDESGKTTRGLCWEDVQERDGSPVLAIYATKTSRTRLVPIQPKLKGLLADVHRDGAAGRIVTRSHSHCARKIRRAIKSAGVEKWDNLFTALRKSCKKDLLKLVIPEAAAKYLGHSPKVGDLHYDGDAVALANLPAAVQDFQDPEPSKKVGRFLGQQREETPCNEQKRHIAEDAPELPRINTNFYKSLNKASRGGRQAAIKCLSTLTFRQWGRFGPRLECGSGLCHAGMGCSISFTVTRGSGRLNLVLLNPAVPPLKSVVPSTV